MTYEVLINGATYEASAWETVENGESLVTEWRAGFVGGMGDYLRSAQDSYYFSSGFDLSMYPFIRLRKQWDQTQTVATLNTARPLYVLIVSSGGTEYIYVLNDRYAWKFSASFATLHSTYDFGANAVVGRPVKFNGTWEVPLGASVDAVGLTIVGVGAGADTWTNRTGQFALHYATMTRNTIAQIAKAFNTNKVSLSASASSGYGDAFQVGTSSEAITDMLTMQNELRVVKTDNVFSFDRDGNSFPLLSYLPGANVAYAGANSWVHGAYFYWPMMGRCWRLVGSRSKEVDPATAERWIGAAIDSVTPIPNDTPANLVAASVTSWGRWLYWSRLGDLFAAEIQEDGTLLWHGMIYTGSTNLRVHVATTSASGPLLIVAGTAANTIRVMSLEDDGSLKSTPGSARGTASSSYEVVLPGLDNNKPNRAKQLRRMYGYAIGVDATSPFQMAVLRDTGTGTSENVGTTITAAGFFERAWTPGANDSAYRYWPIVKMATTAGYVPATSDPRLLWLGIEAAGPTVYRCVLLLTPGGMNAKAQALQSMLLQLRRLVAGVTVQVRGPFERVAWTGHILENSEKATKEGYQVSLSIERWDRGA